MPFIAPIVGGIASAAGASAATAGAIGSIASGVGSGLAGAISGSRGNEQSAGQRQQLAVMQDFAGLVERGPGAEAVGQSLAAQNELAAELERLRREGTGPTAQDIASQQSLAGQLFRQRQVGLEQDFARQQQGFEQTAARLGRSPLDPVFRNKLAEQQLQAQERLGAEQSTFATQRALEQPFQRLQLQQGRANVLQGLATQALSNRQALAGLGREAAGIRPQGEGGGFLGGLTGAIGGFSRGLAGGAQGAQLGIDLFGRSGGGQAQPSAGNPFSLGVDTSFSGFKL